MAEDQHGDGHGIHLPGPSLAPLVLSLGVALMVGGFVPENLGSRLAIVSLGATLVIGSAYMWLRHALAEYRGLPD
jgi:hypothetical protein